MFTYIMVIHSTSVQHMCLQGVQRLDRLLFTWEESAVDALIEAKLTEVQRWTVEEALYQMERWNGMGYRRRGVNSPYLWGGSNHYQSGKFVGARFDQAVVSRLIGAAVLLKFAIPKEDLAAIPTAE